MLTDANGRFVFHSLAAGARTPSVPRTRTTCPAISARRRLSLRAQAGAWSWLTVIDSPTSRSGSGSFASISGVIQDEAGEPAVGASIRLVIATSGAGGARQYRMITLGRDRRPRHVPLRFACARRLPCCRARRGRVRAARNSRRVSRRNGNWPRRRRCDPHWRAPASGGSLTTGGTRVGDFLVQPLSVRVGLATPLIVGEGGRTFVYPTTFYPAATDDRVGHRHRPAIRGRARRRQYNGQTGSGGARIRRCGRIRGARREHDGQTGAGWCGKPAVRVHWGRNRADDHPRGRHVHGDRRARG